jgi:small multidrug resistance pump
MIYFILALSIVCEVVATTSLKASDGFTRLVPSAITVVFYSTAFYLLTIPMKQIPTGILYAIWSGAGVVLISLIGWLLQGQKIDLPGIIGIAFIVTGVLIINILSKSIAH